MPRVLVIEDHPLFCQALVQLLRNSLGATVCLASHAEEGLVALKEQPDIDLVILDLGLPGLLRGCDAVSAVRQGYAKLPILVVSGSDDPATVQAALDAGADAYLVKTASTELFGQTFRKLIGSGATTPHRLTDRQREILRLLCDGLSNKEIGRKLNLSDATVKMHMTAVLRAMGVSTRTQAALSARQLGLDAS